jgi:hypothetical protein
MFLFKCNSVMRWTLLEMETPETSKVYRGLCELNIIVLCANSYHTRAACINYQYLTGLCDLLAKRSRVGSLCDNVVC